MNAAAAAATARQPELPSTEPGDTLPRTPADAFCCKPNSSAIGVDCSDGKGIAPCNEPHPWFSSAAGAVVRCARYR